MPEPASPDPNPQDPVNQIRESILAETTPRPTRQYRALIFQGFMIAALVSFILLAFISRTSAYFPIDLIITHTLQALDLPGLSLLMRLVSWPGYAPQAAIVVTLIVGLLYLAGLKWEALVSGGAAAAGQALNLLFKLIIQRPRPSADLVDVFRHLTDFSFPSGHVMFYTSFFGCLWFLSFTLLKHSWKRTILLLIFGGLVMLVGPSRIYLGEHWASDVLGAYLVGSLILIAAILIYRRHIYTLSRGRGESKPGSESIVR